MKKKKITNFVSISEVSVFFLRLEFRLRFITPIKFSENMNNYIDFDVLIILELKAKEMKTQLQANELNKVSRYRTKRKEANACLENFQFTENRVHFIC